MTRKKDSNILVSEEDEAQARHLLVSYHQIAGDLRLSKSREQAEAALAEIYNMPEASQVALLKILAKEHDTDAADILAALYELSPSKNIRKEARRSLIRLAEVKIHPHWSPPSTAPLVTAITANAPRFWKGMVTQAREQGELELVLCWEQGLDYNEVRILVFLLDFWKEGVKDFFTRTGTKRRLDADIAERQAKLKDIAMIDCTLAEGRRLIEEALSVNQWRGTAPYKDYRHNLPTIRQLVLEATNIGEDRGRTFINPELEPDEVIADFIGGWSMGDFGLAYDLLASNSSLREGLTRDEWVERRRAWADEAHPGSFSVSFIHEREPQQKGLWLPTPLLGSYTPSRKEIEVGWSLELDATPLSGTLREMPMGTVVNKATGRHWFWTSYTFVHEEGAWRMQSMTDEGANAQGLSIEELQDRIEELREDVQEINQEYSPRPKDSEVLEYLEEVIWRITKAMHYSDALIVKLPLDRSVYEEASAQAQGARATERATVYLERMAQRFPDWRGNTLRQLGVLFASLKDMYEEDGVQERSKQFFNLAEKAFRDAMAADNSPLTYALLAELLIDDRERFDEAQTLLHKAQTLAPTRAEETVIEACLGSIAAFRNQQEEALRHFSRAAELSPAYPTVWYNIGHTQRMLERYEEAESSLKRAIEVNDDLRVYVELATVYMIRKKNAEAREILERGLRVYPESAHLRAMLALMFIDSGDRRHAQKLLAEAERINPDLEIVKTARQLMNQFKKR